MASQAKSIPYENLIKVWLDENHLMLLSCWSRDGYTYQDIANRIGISPSALRQWRLKHPEIEQALSEGREIIDYKVENALLKAALGYKTRDVKVTTTIKNGRVIETHKETIDREQAPNVSAAQCWLYNRLPKKWKNMNSRANILEDMDEDTSVQITVTRASKGSMNTTTTSNNSSDDSEEWDDINESISIRPMTEQEKKEAKKEQRAKKKAEQEEAKKTTKIQFDEEQDPDEWPEDWEDDDEEWEE